jgi:type VI secretion system secreted protein Hcp
MAGDMFLKFEGGPVTVEGEATAKDHDNWVDIDSFSWGVHQIGTFGRGGGGGAGKAEATDVVISKLVDKAGPPAFKGVCTGAHFDKATLEVRKAGGEQIVYYSLELEHVFISSLNDAGSGDQVSQSMSLNYKKITYTYYPQADQGSQEGAVIASYDFGLQEEG